MPTRPSERHQHHQREQVGVEAAQAREVHARHRGARDADEAVGAAGDVAEAEQHGIAELREGEREHGKGHAGRAGAYPRNRNCDHDRDGHRQQDGRRQRQRHVCQNERVGISAETIGGGVPERVEPAIPHEQIEAHREQAEDQRLD